MVSTWAKSTERIAWACAARNWRQVGPDRRGGGIDAGGLQDFPHHCRGDRGAEADQLTADASISPPWVLAGQPQHQRPHGLRDGWLAGLSSRVGPVAGHELGMPSQQRSWRDQPELA
jgi:hypothetical protein